MDNNRDNRGLENERRIDHLINLVERKTRSERHLEEHSDISKSRENIEHVQNIQKQRNDEIQNLKNIIVHGENHNNNYLENTEKRFLYTEGYLNHNADQMDKETFKNTKVKQEHRKEQMDFLK